MHYVYILKCCDNSFYTGITWDLKKRLLEHNFEDKCLFTKSRRPVKLVYSESYKDKFAAARREQEIKGWSRKKKERLINSLH
ncbi:MAG: GIY-YIG nuclease family protein [bacterium]